MANLKHNFRLLSINDYFLFATSLDLLRVIKVKRVEKEWHILIYPKFPIKDFKVYNWNLKNKSCCKVLQSILQVKCLFKSFLKTEIMLLSFPFLRNYSEQKFLHFRGRVIWCSHPGPFFQPAAEFLINLDTRIWRGTWDRREERCRTSELHTTFVFFWKDNL